MPAITLTLPRPHTKQWAIKHHSAKRQVICAGRRAGKTTLAAMVACERALAGRRVLVAAPKQEQTNPFWEKCKDWLRSLISQGYIYKNEQRHVLDFPGGGRIRAKTAWDADTLTGDYADFLILDEYAQMDSDAWNLVGAPMLLDNDGDAWFISTPRRKNHFFQLYARAMQDGNRWKEWHFTSHDNPHLSKVALAEITQDMSEADYKQEILAEFLEAEGAVFRNIAACMNAPLESNGQHKDHNIVAGVDWAQKQDYTTIALLCADCWVEVARDRFNQINYSLQRDRLKALCERWQPSIILAEDNSIGAPNVQALQEEGLPVVAFTTTSKSKGQIIRSLQLAFEREEVQWQSDRIWTAELEAYEQKISPTTGRATFSAPQGVHDDCVIARALALRAMGRVVSISDFGIW